MYKILKHTNLTNNEKQDFTKDTFLGNTHTEKEVQER